MSEIKRTKAQNNAVTSRGRSLMISAAAGSGKTRTLTERIISLLCDPQNPADISKMLIVTFTKKAAGELRERITAAIAAALAENPSDMRLSAQLTRVGGAPICTIDSYYLGLVREHFQNLGLPASFRMADPAESDILAKNVADALIENKFKNDPDFPHLADTLTTARTDDSLADIIIAISKKTQNLPGGPDDLAESAALYAEEAKADYYESRAGRISRAMFSAFINRSLCALERDIEIIDSNPEIEKYRKAIENDKAQIDALHSMLNSGAGYAEIQAKVQAFEALSLSSIGKGKSELSECVKNDHGEIRDTFKDLKIKDFALSAEAVSRSMSETSAVLTTLASLIRDFNDSFIEAKSRNLIADFADLSRFTLSLLRDSEGNPTPAALNERKRYTHIFVDEYQDTNYLQDSIFNLISTDNNLFIVGDVKQSIYGFRGAQPDVFSAYRGRWADFDKVAEGEPAAIYMSENFRCSKAVIDFTNTVCGKLFAEAENSGLPGSGIGYRREDDLIYAGKSPSVSPVGIYLCDGREKPDDDSAPDLPKSETDGSAAEIRALIEKIRECAERRGSPSAPAYGDIAVLCLTSAPLSNIASALAKEGIPYINNGASDLFENPEVLLFYSLLCAIDNPMRDIHLSAALRSPILGFTISDLADCRNEKRDCTLWEAICAYPGSEAPIPELAQKCTNARKALLDYRRLSCDLPVDRFIRLLWKKTCAPAFSGSDPSSVRQRPQDRRSNLRSLYELARSYKNSGFRTLHDFVAYVGDLLENNTKIEVEPAPAENAVNLMTVHKSKGLEFPAVFLANSSGLFNQSDERGTCIFTRVSGLGFATKLTDPTGMCIQDTPMRLAVSGLLSELGQEEKIRELYVALTRAREELYIFAHGSYGTADKLFEKAESCFRNGTAVLSGSKFISWILNSLAGLNANKPDGFFRITYVAPDSIKEERCENYEPASFETDSESQKAAAFTTEADGAVRSETYSASGSDSALQTNPASDVEIEAEKKAYEKIKSALDFEYPYAYVSKIPAKLSVSKLYPELMTDAENDESEASLSEDEDYIPAFIGTAEATAAERGTATHLFLQFCDFNKLDGTDKATDDEINRLVNEKFIPERSAALIRRFEINRFARSFFAKLLKAAKIQYREQRFNILLPASEFTEDKTLSEKLKDEKILVQGVIDLLLESPDGKIVLCDYKTDRIDKYTVKDPDAVAKMMKERHARQLGYYSEAIEKMFGRRPDSILVFPLAYGEAVEIN